jgi:SAM-dependent methyltransferase
MATHSGIDRIALLPEKDSLAMSTIACPSCGSTQVTTFYEVANVPVHSVLLMPSREEARRYPRGNIKLGFCAICGFIYNTLFDPKVHEYSAHCEETQGFSETFNSFSHKLATYLVERYDLHEKNILEIGCGKGEFLTLLCEMGHNRGIGFDPGYLSERISSPAQDRLTFIKDFYTEKYADYHADFICCKMTLEHIDRVADFVKIVQHSTKNYPETTIFFQLPDVTRILYDLAFWDVYYEHCSYFSPGSLARLFRQEQFDVLQLWRDYDDQYIMIEAKPAQGKDTTFPELEKELEYLGEGVRNFAQNASLTLDTWKNTIQDLSKKGKRTVLWGSGSKAVAFLTTLGIEEEIQYAVDINPHRHGTFLAGTGQAIVAPQFLQEYQPDTVIIMNPIYRAEIKRDLDALGLNPNLMLV